MEWTVFKKALLVAIVLHALVFVSIYLGLLGVFAEVGGNFCEAAREGFIKQPANTFSNLGFAFFGLLAAYQFTKGKFTAKNVLTSSTSFAFFFIVLMIALAPGSMAMHATETYLGGYFDMLTMYLVNAYIVAYALDRLFFLKPRYFYLIFLLVLGITHFFHFSKLAFPLVGFAGNFIFAFFLVLTFTLEMINHFKNKTAIELKWAIASVLTMLCSFLIWTTGRDAHPWCHPYSFLQAHAIWHILDATAIYFLFRFYVSENDVRFKSE